MDWNCSCDTRNVCPVFSARDMSITSKSTVKWPSFTPTDQWLKGQPKDTWKEFFDQQGYLVLLALVCLFVCLFVMARFASWLLVYTRPRGHIINKPHPSQKQTNKQTNKQTKNEKRKRKTQWLCLEILQFVFVYQSVISHMYVYYRWIIVTFS